MSKRTIVALAWSSVVALQLLIVSDVRAQDVKVSGGFLSDSLKIGEETAFYLSARYRSELTALFPDSTFGFVPFEYQKRVYFPTRSENGISFDSAIYYITTFEVDRVQYLDLPVYIAQPQDCTEYRSSRDSVLITQLVAHVPDSLSADKLPLKVNTAYQKVFFDLNMWVIVISIAVVLILALLIWIFFGKRISRYFETKKLLRNHSKFMEAYSKFLAQLQATFSVQTSEDALAAWKKYMEQLESVPYTKLTTKETLLLIHDESLAKNLSQLDRSIYGHETSVIAPLEHLRVYADEHFSQRLKQLAHGTRQ